MVKLDLTNKQADILLVYVLAGIDALREVVDDDGISMSVRERGLSQLADLHRVYEMLMSRAIMMSDGDEHRQLSS